MDVHLHFEHLKGSSMVAYLRYDELKSKSTTVYKVTHVLCHVKDVKTFDGEPYEVYHVDCIMSDGKVQSYDNVLDVMIE